MSCNLDYIDPTSEYKKRFPSDCKDKTKDTKHFLNDKKINTQLYAYFQNASYAVDIKDDKGKVIGHETRVNVKDIPSQRKLTTMIGDFRPQDDGTIVFKHISREKLRNDWNYLFSPSVSNVYCPYIRLSEDGTYYILDEKERYGVLIPQPIVQYLVAGFSNYAIKIYLYLYTMNNWFQHKKEEEAKQQQKLLKTSTQEEQAIQLNPNTTDLQTAEQINDKPKKLNQKDYFQFTLTDILRNIGGEFTNIKNRPDVWNSNEEKARTDQNYKLGYVALAMIALRNGQLIEWETVHDEETGHKVQLLTKVNTDIKTIILPKDKQNKLADNTTKSKPIKENNPTPEFNPNYQRPEMSEECKRFLQDSFAP